MDYRLRRGRVNNNRLLRRQALGGDEPTRQMGKMAGFHSFTPVMCANWTAFRGYLSALPAR